MEELISLKIKKKIGNRIKTLREDLNLTQKELALKLGLNGETAVANYEAGYSIPKDEIKLKMCELFNCSMDYLMCNSDIRNIEINIQRFASNTPESNAFPTSDYPIKVPVLGKISAGLPILATENIEGFEFAPSSYIKEGFDYFYLKVDGDSMNLKFNNGDIVLVQKQDTLENDEIGVILVEDEATVKKFKHEKEMIILYPMSTNPEHTVQIYKEEQIKIIGKVVSYQGKI